VTAGAAARVVVAVAGRPPLWATAVRQLVVMSAPGWWRRWPPLPLPPPGYLRFRLQTAYGDPDRPPEATDVVAWLEWCKHMRAIRPAG
jgi:hypothetical protein